MGAFRSNSITRNIYFSFVKYLDDIALVSLKGDMTTNSPASTELAHNFKVSHSLADSFKRSIKRDAIIFATVKEGKY